MKKLSTICIIIIALFSVQLNGAENDPECQPDWDWVWKTQPELDITAPQNIPDSCIGLPLSIGPAVLTNIKGVKREKDLNQCDPNNLYRNETDVFLSPTNSWVLYQGHGNGNPDNGSGLTANFTPSAAGTYSVIFATEADVVDPSWYDAKTDMSGSFRVFEVDSISATSNGHIMEWDDKDNDPDTILYLVDH